ncbi:hypothetical protein Hypma_006121 [Hypsizygus marmoreus]|uniref:Uncharacterized protein n=1 Tax=Hypsizygus marmoreus TaxID=39966 RepID=A0A369JW88_HYPMA|nr:hypothetical protein Hypma_006121 [Hypsizygus marmoreus]
MASAYRAVMDIGPNWFHSPPPTRGATPLPQQHNPYLDLESADEQFPAGYPYRSRIRPDRLVVTDPEHFTVGNLDESLIDRSQRNSLSSRTLGIESQTHRGAETQYPKDEPGEEMSELARVVVEGLMYSSFSPVFSQRS